jgi:Lrp/AsnC family transcriptional regulator for asnA, asnC and gidA
LVKNCAYVAGSGFHQLPLKINQNAPRLWCAAHFAKMYPATGRAAGHVQYSGFPGEKQQAPASVARCSRAAYNKSMIPDEVDWDIIKTLQKGYVPNNTIARKLSISEGTVRLRLKKLKEAGIVEVKALINPDALENKLLVLVAMRLVESRLLEAKAEEVARLANVLSVSIVSGHYDLIAEVLVDSNHGLVKFLTEQLAAVEGINYSESFLTLKNYNKFV